MLTAAVVPFTGCFVNAYPLSNESFNNLAEDSLQTEASLVSKKHLHAVLHLQAFQKNKGSAGLPAMVNADLCYARYCNRSDLNSKTPNFDT